MSDETQAPPAPPMNKTIQAILGMLVLAFNGSMIAWLVFFGHSENSLHVSGLSWFFTASIFIMAGFGLGSSQVTKILETIKR